MTSDDMRRRLLWDAVFPPLAPRLILFGLRSNDGVQR